MRHERNAERLPTNSSFRSRFTLSVCSYLKSSLDLKSSFRLLRIQVELPLKLYPQGYAAVARRLATLNLLIQVDAKVDALREHDFAA